MAGSDSIGGCSGDSEDGSGLVMAIFLARGSKCLTGRFSLSQTCPRFHKLEHDDFEVLTATELLDTPHRIADGILGSPKPLKLESLRHLTQRWDSPQALIRVCPTLFAQLRVLFKFEGNCPKVLFVWSLQIFYLLLGTA